MILQTKHRLAFAKIISDPKQPTLSVVALVLIFGVFEDLVVQVSEEATLSLLDALLVIAGVSRL
jgi:hypothetical protein